MNRFLPYLSLFFMLFATSCITEDEPETESLKPGDACPTFSVEMHDGSIISTNDLKGETSIIIFFNTSCADCREELPEIQKVYNHIIEENIPANLLCIAREEETPSIESFWKENALSLPYSPQPDRRVYNLFATSIIPRIYIISPELIITRVWTDNPMPSAEEIIAYL